jgi:surface antigen
MLLAAALAAAVVVCAGAAAPSRTREAARGKLVVFGYPYTARCPAAGRNEVVDRWGMYACNCTSYVAWALHANHQRTDWFIRGSMDAWNWPNVARMRGLTVVSRPRPRFVAVWPKLGGHFGHVAYVTRVHGDGTFDVAEYNLPGDRRTHFRFDERRDVSTHGATFIAVPAEDEQ